MRFFSIVSAFLLMINASLSVAFEFCVDKDRELFRSVVEGDVAKLRSFLVGGGDPNFNCWDYKIGRMGTTLDLYYYVVKSSNMGLIQLYVKDDRLSQNNLDSMLHSSLHRIDIPVSKFLVKKGAIFRAYNIEHYFVQSFRLNDDDFLSYMELVDYLGGDFSTMNSSVFRDVIVNRDGWLNEDRFIRSVRFLSKRMDINGFERPFINKFVCTMDLDELELFLDLGVNINKKDDSGNDALMSVACCNENTDAFRSKLLLLLNSDSDFESTNKKGETFEMIAISCGNLRAISLFNGFKK